MAQAVRGSLANGSSLSHDSAGAFDVTSEAGALSLLRSVHRSSLDQEIKNTLRDALFTFRQEGGDYKSLIRMFEEVGFVISSSAKTQSVIQSQDVAEAPKSASLGRVRPVPNFVTQASSSDALPIHKVPIRVNAVDEEEKQHNELESQVPVYQPPEATATDKSPVEEKKTAPDETVAPIEQTAAPESKKPIDRIKEIKHAVNEKVGNPISLIDANNEVGREYMNALLAAMKVVNGGTEPEVRASMGRLEKVYASVMDLNLTSSKLEDKSIASSFVQSQSNAQEEQVTATPETVNHTEEPVTSELAINDTAPPTSFVPESVSTDQAEKPSLPIAPVVPAAEEKKEPQSEDVKPSQDIQSETPAVPKATNVTRPPEQTSGTGMVSVAKEEQLQRLMQQNRAAEVADNKKKEDSERASMDPLMTPEVNAGLKQLLSEWGLFKSSGFFGTGPSGSDHPLYKKLAPLTMAAVIAGRFEGATPQIKQSITDYMNGWRYEEGIVHEHAETFERYLRKVIKHILSKQKSKSSQ